MTPEETLMPFSVDKLPDLPAILFVQSGGQVIAETEAALASLVPVLDEQPEPVFLMMDVRALTIGLDDLTSVAGAATLRPDAVLHHPNVRETLVISGDALIKLASQGLRSATFGGVKVRTFRTPEEALGYCRSQVAEKVDRSASSATG